MEKYLIEIFNLLALLAVIIIPFLKIKSGGILTAIIMTVQVVISLVVVYLIFSNGFVEYYYPGSWVTGIIPIRIDYLSAWFILIISLTFLTGVWYGLQYMKKYIAQPNNLKLHTTALILVYTALFDICVIHNGLVLLIFWEIMALSSFMLIIFEHNKTETLKAGINFLIQSHISILFLTIGFMWVKIKTNSFDLADIAAFSTQPAITAIGLFIFFFFGFAIKSGFVPFHTWLPLAHPAAPAHISGIMSGVIIKIGIYGIFRMLLLIKADMIVLGYFILVISVITGVYGVMLAIVQHNLKRLLAYHSIENIGIIGMGIGLGCLGAGYNNQILVITGFGGALLHTLNHSLFKSLLFYTAGNVYHFTKTMNIEAMGGLIKKIPHSAYLFLLGSLAICGLPPFNGFVSEFFIFKGLFYGLLSNHFLFTLFILFNILGLVLIGGLALICFTKAFGIVFLGTPRKKPTEEVINENPLKIIPLYVISVFILLIGIFPIILTPLLGKIIQLYLPNSGPQSDLYLTSMLETIATIGWYSLGFVVLTALLYFIRHLYISNRALHGEVTWGCGYTGNPEKMQYTASSFIRTFRGLAQPVLLIKKEKKVASGLYPGIINQSTHPKDKIETWLIDKPVFYIKRFLNRFIFLQNGNIQSYILYGFIFVGLALILPVVIKLIMVFVKFLNQL